MAQIIYPNGREEQVMPANGKTFTLKELQNVVGGYIEILNIGDKFMVVDEEGKLKGYESNAKATVLYHSENPYSMKGDHVVGTVLICDCDMIE